MSENIKEAIWSFVGFGFMFAALFAALWSVPLIKFMLK